jgi:phage terminase Nu1 subunit (DNA packaging protein)
LQNSVRMNAEDKTLNLFTTRMRQMILLYKEKTQENKELFTMLEEQKKKTIQLQSRLTQIQHDYENLKMAKMLEINTGDLEFAKNRVSKIIRDINKCITLLNTK